MELIKLNSSIISNCSATTTNKDIQVFSKGCVNIKIRKNG